MNYKVIVDAGHGGIVLAQNKRNGYKVSKYKIRYFGRKVSFLMV